MANYTKTFGGALKDSQKLTIQGADWDTEYDKIETAIATKANKDTGDTGEIVELTAAGDILAAGPLASNLSGLTSNLQTGIEAVTPDPTDTSEYVASGAWHLRNGTNDENRALISSLNHGNGDVYTVGPVGSGADYTSSPLNDVPSTARIAIIAVSLKVTFSGTGFFGSNALKCYDTGVSSPSGALEVLAVLVDDGAASSTYGSGIALVPISSDGIMTFYNTIYSNKSDVPTITYIDVLGYIDNAGS